MQEEAIRKAIREGVDAYAASAREHPCLHLQVLARANKEETGMKKKLPLAAVLLIALLLAALTATAIGLTVRDIWNRSFEQMNTTGWIHTISDEEQAEIPVEEAIAIAREAIISKYATPSTELDAMGVYPGYYARGWDGEDYESPSEWEVFFSSRTDVDLDLDHDDYGPTGEYRVYINAETREVTYCHWYTNDFWARAQIIWDCGSRDEIYWWYGQPGFYSLPEDTQAYWVGLLKEAGYRVVEEDEKLHQMLLTAATWIHFQPLTAIADERNPQVAAAWAEMERMGYDTEVLRRYAYVATIPVELTGAYSVCIHYSYEKEFDLKDKCFLDPYSANLFSWATNFGTFMFTFEPGTTEIIAVTQVTRAEDIRQEPVTQGKLLDRNVWGPEDLATFDAAYQRLDMGVKRMRAAGLDDATMHTIVNDYLYDFGRHEVYQDAPEGLDAAVWFADESEWDAQVTVPAMSYEEFTARYGSDDRFWPMEALCDIDPRTYRMPNPGETTLEDAAHIAMEAVIAKEGEQMRSVLADYEVFVRRISLTADPDAVDCRWEVCIVSDHEHPTQGFRISWGEWEEVTDQPIVQDINDRGNG